MTLGKKNSHVCAPCIEIETDRHNQSYNSFVSFVSVFFLLPVKYKEEGRNAQKIPNNNKRVKNVLKSAFWLKVSGRTKKK